MKNHFLFLFICLLATQVGWGIDQDSFNNDNADFLSQQNTTDSDNSLSLNEDDENLNLDENDNDADNNSSNPYADPLDTNNTYA